VGANDGYLLDTNIISILCRPDDLQRAAVDTNFKAVTGPIMISAISIAEIEFGLAKSTGVSVEQAEELRKFLKGYPHPLAFDVNTVPPYALIRAKLWQEYATPKGKGHKEKLPEELFERVHGKVLGIDEKDLMIAAIAAEYDLVLATNDCGQSMKRIELVAKALNSEGASINLRIEYWPK
jgi:predicted nucleic acid-binding protein